MVNCLTPFLSLPSLCFKWKGEWERMNPSAQNDSSVRFLGLIALLTVCESSVPPPRHSSNNLEVSLSSLPTSKRKAGVLENPVV